MTKPMPDTDPLKREPPGAVSKVPHKEVDRTALPGGNPDEQGGAATGGREVTADHINPPPEPTVPIPGPDEIPQPDQDEVDLPPSELPEPSKDDRDINRMP